MKNIKTALDQASYVIAMRQGFPIFSQILMRYVRAENRRLIRGMDTLSQLRSTDEGRGIVEILTRLTEQVLKKDEEGGGAAALVYPDYICLDKSFKAVNSRYICRSGFLLSEIPLIFL
jgi:hypothetical protein